MAMALGTGKVALLSINPLHQWKSRRVPRALIAQVVQRARAVARIRGRSLLRLDYLLDYRRAQQLHLAQALVLGELLRVLVRGEAVVHGAVGAAAVDHHHQAVVLGALHELLYGGVTLGQRDLMQLLRQFLKAATVRQPRCDAATIVAVGGWAGGQAGGRTGG